MNILTFDTCLDKMYVALGTEEKLLSSKIVETTETSYHSAFLISTIKNLLKENNLEPKDIDVIATNRGPGSFTGIRACTTVARVFAQAFEIKTVGISSLEIISRISQENKKTLVALDARKEMAYVGIFENKKQIFEPQAVLLDDVKKMLSSDEYVLITDDKMESVLGGKSYQKCDDDLGKYLYEIALEKLATEYDTNWRKLLPLYIQPPAVNLKKAAN